MAQSLFEKLGGESRLREIMDTFVDRVFADRMIAFFFATRTRAASKSWNISWRPNFLAPMWTIKDDRSAARMRTIRLWAAISLGVGKFSRRHWNFTRCPMRSRTPCFAIPMRFERKLPRKLALVATRISSATESTGDNYRKKLVFPWASICSPHNIVLIIITPKVVIKDFCEAGRPLRPTWVDPLG